MIAQDTSMRDFTNFQSWIEYLIYAIRLVTYIVSPDQVEEVS